MNTLEHKIALPKIDAEVVADEIGNFIVDKTIAARSTGGVIGLSGGVDSTTTAALAKRAFDRYNAATGRTLELVGYILPTKTNNPADAVDGEKVAKRLGIRYEIHSIQPVLEAYGNTNPEAFGNHYDKGNLSSRVRATILNTKAATEKKILLGTGNKDEDFGIGYYTLFGDGAVHISPIGGLSKRLVREMATHLGFADFAHRVPTAGLEPGQTDFKDLGYEYDVVEIVSEGITQGLPEKGLYSHPAVIELAKKSIADYKTKFGVEKFSDVKSMVDDVLFRHHYVAKPKAALISPPIAPVTLVYK